VMRFHPAKFRLRRPFRCRVVEHPESGLSRIYKCGALFDADVGTLVLTSFHCHFLLFTDALL